MYLEITQSKIVFMFTKTFIWVQYSYTAVMNFEAGCFAAKMGVQLGNKYSSTGGKGLSEIRHDLKLNVSKKIVPFQKNFM